MKMQLAPWILGALFLLCYASRVIAQHSAPDAVEPSSAAEPTVVETAPPASSAVESAAVSPSGVLSSSALDPPAVTGNSTSVLSDAISETGFVKPTASKSPSANSPQATESVSPSNSDQASDANTVNIFGLTLGIIPLIAIVLGLAFIVLYIVMRCVLRRRKLEVRRMRESFSNMRTRFNRTVGPKTAVIPEARPTPTARKMHTSTSNTLLYRQYPQMSQSDSTASLSWTSPAQSQSNYGDARYISEQGYQRQNYQHPGHLTQPQPVHQHQPQQQQQVYQQPHGYAYGYGGLQKIDGMYGVVDGYYGYSHGDRTYLEHQPPAANPYTHPQAYLPEANDGTYRINMEHGEVPTPAEHYQNDNTGGYANVNYYTEGTQSPQRTSTTQHYDPGMLRPRRSSRGVRPMPYTIPQSEPLLPSTYLDIPHEEEPRELRAVNCASPTSTSDATKTGDDSAV